VIRTIVFDFGNVLAFFDHRLIAKRLQPHTKLELEQVYGKLFGGELEDQYERGQLTTTEVLCRVRQALGLGCADDVLIEAYCDIFRPNPEIESLLPELKRRCQLLVASNTTELHARQFRKQFANLLSWFDRIALSYEIGVRKPGAAFFDHCLAMAGSVPEECLFIDDIPANVAGARTCGWDAILFQGVPDLRRQLVQRGLLEVDEDRPDIE
jgi:putative hydrolase of the HAD superfamily